MATNFPTSVDSFTNPTAVDTLDSPPHDQQHADANDAIEAIETALLDGAPLHIDAANERVGIGTDTPLTNLDINGNSPSLVFTSPSDTNRYRIDANMTDAADYGMSLGYWDGAAYQRTLTVDATGKVGINDTAPSYTLDVTGTINATGDLRIGGTAIGAWTSYTPTLYFSSVGNGTIAGRYMRINDLIVVEISFTLGSTSTIATGHRYSLPVSPADSTTGWFHAQSVFYDASAGKDYIGSAVANDAGGNIRPVVFEVSATYVDDAENMSVNTPFTWATGDFTMTKAIYAV